MQKKIFKTVDLRFHKLYNVRICQLLLATREVYVVKLEKAERDIGSCVSKILTFLIRITFCHPRIKETVKSMQLVYTNILEGLLALNNMAWELKIDLILVYGQKYI